MRSIWKGVISFGLVSVAVKLYSATEEKAIRFHQIHDKDDGRIRYRRTCLACGEEVTYDDIAKGYDLGGDQIVVLTDEDFAELPLATSHAIDVLEFVPADQVDPILYTKAYYLEPDGVANKPYVLMRDALTRSDRVAIVKVTLRQREQLATLRVHESVLMLNTMLWPDEVRRPDFKFLGENVEARPAELAMAGSLIDSMAADFAPSQYTDDYRTALQRVIDAKVAGRAAVKPAEEKGPEPEMTDLMAALRASVDRARAARGEPDGKAKSQPARTAVTRGAARKAVPKQAVPVGRAVRGSTTAAKKAAQARPAQGQKKAATSTAKKEPGKSAAKKTPAKKAATRPPGASGQVRLARLTTQGRSGAG